MGISNYIMSVIPAVEVCVRCIYYRVKNIELIKRNPLVKRIKSHKVDGERSEIASGSWENYSNSIKQFNIKNGDILIVHSSMDALKKFGIEKEVLVEFLRSLVGEKGTLVMPAYPFYKRKDIKLQFDEEEEEILNYKPRSSLAWTGLLPNYLCSLKETKRSYFPLDTLAAIGREATEMMENNLAATTSHGRNTAWEYCYKHHAKVLFLGVSPKDSISEIHLYEDLNEDKWPIKGWYKKQKFNIKLDGKKIEFVCKYRKKFWNQFITENYCTKNLIDGGVLEYGVIENTPLGFIRDLYDMTGYVAECVTKDYNLLFWRIPKKYWK